MLYQTYCEESMKFINSRIIQKHATEQEWKTSGLVPYKGELIVYDVDDTCNFNRFKVGDGIHTVNELPFSTAQPDWDQSNPSMADHIKNRPCYLTTLYDIQVPLSGADEVVKVWDFDGGNYLELAKVFLNADSILIPYGETVHTDSYGDMQQYEQIFLGGWISSATLGETLSGMIISDYHATYPQVPPSITRIDTINFIYKLNGLHYYFIYDLTTLTEEYRDKFAEVGLYAIPKNAGFVMHTAVVKLYQPVVQLANYFIPNNIARKSDLPTKVSELENDNLYLTNYYVTFTVDWTATDDGSLIGSGTCDRTYDEVLAALADPTKRVIGIDPYNVCGELLHIDQYMYDRGVAFSDCPFKNAIRYAHRYVLNSDNTVTAHDSYTLSDSEKESARIGIGLEGMTWHDSPHATWWYGPLATVDNLSGFDWESVDRVEQEHGENLFGSLQQYVADVLFGYQLAHIHTRNISAINALNKLVDYGVLVEPSITYAYRPGNQHMDCQWQEYNDYEIVNLSIDGDKVVIKLLSSTVRHTVPNTRGMETESVAYYDPETKKIVKEKLSPFYWETDTSLSQADYPADAKAVGDRVSYIDKRLPYVLEGTWEQDGDGANYIELDNYDAKAVFDTYSSGSNIVLRLACSTGEETYRREFNLLHASITGLTDQQLTFVSAEVEKLQFIALYDGTLDDIYDRNLTPTDDLTLDFTPANAKKVGLELAKLDNKIAEEKYIITGTYDHVEQQYAIEYDNEELLRRCQNGSRVGLHITDNYGYVREYGLHQFTAEDPPYFTFTSSNDVGTAYVGLCDGTVDEAYENTFVSKEDLKSVHKSINITWDTYDGVRRYKSNVAFYSIANGLQNGSSYYCTLLNEQGFKVRVPLVSSDAIPDANYSPAYVFATVYPGVTEDTWMNLYKVMITINSSNQVTVKQDVVSTVSLTEVSEISNNIN